ncbi:hypothetical protein RJT34_25785 [Clitoria ternatea]|uniref:Uncharacterized protein n=1 Tax=Clitoria ternatea TaxID=43366 RepID=A0AAN9IH57_CLITE
MIKLGSNRDRTDNIKEFIRASHLTDSQFNRSDRLNWFDFYNNEAQGLALAFKLKETQTRTCFVNTTSLFVCSVSKT